MNKQELVVGMSDEDTRRHYYVMRDYPLRYCTMTDNINHLVVMTNVTADCKRCLAKKKSFFDREMPIGSRYETNRDD